jgi:signal transduction histidine kinase
MATDSKNGAKIQVIEDDPHLNIAISETLRSYDFVVASFLNGVDALDWLKHNRPDVILCDIMMPEMDGYTLLRHTRSNPHLRTLPFIFLTARTSMDDQRRAREIGVDDYLTKPIDSESLVIAIKNALRRQQIMQEEMQQQMDLLRSRIVNVLQHEFRTPLTFVLGYAEYLLETIGQGVALEELRESAAAILDGGHRLQRLIEGFLLLAELQSYHLKPEDMRDMNAHSLWRSMVVEFQTQVTDSNLRATLAEQNRTAVISGNANLLQEALRRLMDNAIRYRRPESQQIRLSVKSIQPYIGLSIADDGVGMSSEQLKELAKPFEQVDRDNRTAPGAGISLAVIRHIAILHGGKLEITSIPNKGSEFTLWLPAAPHLSEK